MACKLQARLELCNILCSFFLVSLTSIIHGIKSSLFNRTFLYIYVHFLSTYHK
jgi:hypothetical protein